MRIRFQVWIICDFDYIFISMNSDFIGNLCERNKNWKKKLAIQIDVLKNRDKIIKIL